MQILPSFCNWRDGMAAISIFCMGIYKKAILWPFNTIELDITLSVMATRSGSDGTTIHIR